MLCYFPSLLLFPISVPSLEAPFTSVNTSTHFSRLSSNIFSHNLNRWDTCFLKPFLCWNLYWNTRHFMLSVFIQSCLSHLTVSYYRAGTSCSIIILLTSSRVLAHSRHSKCFFQSMSQHLKNIECAFIMYNLKILIWKFLLIF